MFVVARMYNAFPSVRPKLTKYNRRPDPRREGEEERGEWGEGERRAGDARHVSPSDAVADVCLCVHVRD